MIVFGRNRRAQRAQAATIDPPQPGGPVCKPYAGHDWCPDRNAAQDGGQPGAEVQYGEAYMVRLRNPALHSSFIDLATYAARVDDELDVYLLELQVRWTITAWPPSTRQVWAATGTWVQPRTWTHGDDAVREAAELAAEMASGQRSVHGVLMYTFGENVADLVCGWDGQPFDPEGG
jgi:hypothetical protein